VVPGYKLKGDDVAESCACRVLEPSKENLLIHIEGLQATLTKRNARIAELEEQAANDHRVDSARRRGYRDGWKACASRLQAVANKTARDLEDLGRTGFQEYLRGDRLPES